MPLEEDNIPLLLTSNIDFRGINNTSNKLIAKEILDIKNVISKIIISTKTNKNRLKKLYKKDKRINIALVKFNKNKDKKFFKIFASEISTVKYNHKLIENKLEKNKNLYKKDKKTILDLKNENQCLKNNDKILNDIHKKILFLQNENVRLSSKLLSTENQNKIINLNLITSENKRNEFIKLVSELNEYNLKDNILKTNITKQKNELINDKKKTDLYNDIKKTNIKKDLDEIIENIFS
jgi:hypothetical protein